VLAEKSTGLSHSTFIAPLNELVPLELASLIIQTFAVVLSNEMAGTFPFVALES
jgi:hypothetical protein